MLEVSKSRRLWLRKVTSASLSNSSRRVKAEFRSGILAGLPGELPTVPPRGGRSHIASARRITAGQVRISVRTCPRCWAGLHGLASSGGAIGSHIRAVSYLLNGSQAAALRPALVAAPDGFKPQLTRGIER